MPEIVIGSGSTMDDLEAGPYTVTLAAVSNERRTIDTQNGPVEGYDWTFVFEDGSEIKTFVSTATGPRSNQFKFITALNNGKAPAKGDRISTDSLIGRRVIATIEIKESGWPKIAGLSAIPVTRQQRDFAAATGAPVKGPVAVPATAAVSPLRAEAAADDLPF